MMYIVNIGRLQKMTLQILNKKQREAKRGKYDPEFHHELDLSDSSGDKDLETAVLSNPGI